MADVAASCIKPNASELSVWFAADDAELEDARLAMLAAMNKLATVSLVEIPVKEIEEAGLQLVESVPKVGPESMKLLHRDIADLDLNTLHTVAKIIQRHLAEKKDKRITMSQCRDILKKAIADERFPISQLHADISKKL
ncbi:hypothetical protein [Massilia aerilata]|uniref:Uncharacterized protein n=1 Tax=Massilia aerilata TaxID=453817 RepID=A0ABW0RXB1_9BURK